MGPPDPGARGKTSSRNWNSRNRGFHAGLDFTLLTAEAGPCPEANVLGKPGPHKLGGQKPPICMHTRVRESMQSQEQLMM